MQVKDLMSSHLITVDKEETVAAAARLLSRHNVGALPVTAQGGRLVGMLSRADFAAYAGQSGEAAQALRASFGGDPAAE